VLKGASAGDQSGTSVRVAGDINFDGFNDLIIGAPLADPNGDASGTSYVLFGSNQGWASSIELSILGANGFAINGVGTGDHSGNSVGAAGDLDNDSVDDLVVGAHLADPNGDDSGASYVVFGMGGNQNGDVIFADSFEQ
jgi:hypothetical protein